MARQRRKFDEQFKRDICANIRSGEQTITNVCDMHNIHRSVVTTWLRTFTDDVPERTVPGNGAPRPPEAVAIDHIRKLEHENLRLKAKIGELMMEAEDHRRAEVE